MWPWKKVYYILNLADIFYPALLLITIHNRGATCTHTHTHLHIHTPNIVKVIMVAVSGASDAFRWVPLIGKHRQDTLSFYQQNKGVSTPSLPLFLSSAHLSPPTAVNASLCSFSSPALSLPLFLFFIGPVVLCFSLLSLSVTSHHIVFTAWAAGRITGCKQTNRLK